MECNKDEAVRAKTIAEKKLADKDFTGAKKFTLKSQNLYPGLDGISQMLIALDVYIASEKKVSGEPDWYAVLDAKPSDDDETIRKQYRKMVLMLHPDKNKSVGADGAFKILSEAWNLLSDRSKRSAYNQRRNIHQKVSPHNMCSSPSSPHFVNVFHRATSKTIGQSSANTTQTPPARASAKTQAKAKAKAKAKTKAQGKTKTQAPPPAQAPAPAAASATFWTVCHVCKMHHEYYKLYLNQTLLCHGCQKPFLAVEMAPPVNITRPAVSCNKTNIRPVRPEVHFSTPPSSAPKNFCEKVNMNSECKEFDAQRLAKRKRY